MATARPQLSDSARIELIEEIPRRVLGACPICGDPATEEEHVPPLAMGGAKMTLTCARCNNSLGSYVEADLADWYENVFSVTRFSAPGIQGYRNTGPMPLRWTPEGEFVLLLSGRKIDPAVDDMLRGGEVELHVTPPNENRYRLGLLKQSYLAACLQFGFLESEAGDLVRRELLAARDAVSRRDVPISPLAWGLTVYRHHETRRLTSAPLVRALAHSEEESIEGVLLAGRVFVSWSSRVDPDRPPCREPEPFQVRLQVGEPTNGTVSSVTEDE
ncbi:HNH endonuclease [Microbispora bryophytorum]|uniref:HNH endonuclease n=1 Tax=Microbispora bryophytorum TaxID=1460882 RepID=UPI003715CB21